VGALAAEKGGEEDVFDDFGARCVLEAGEKDAGSQVNLGAYSSQSQDEERKKGLGELRRVGLVFAGGGIGIYFSGLQEDERDSSTYIVKVHCGDNLAFGLNFVLVCDRI
jgi:hypothetical protein